MRLALAFVLLVTSAACSHNPVVTTNPMHPMPKGEYIQLFRKRTRHTDQYTGFYQTFQADVTILSSDMLAAGLNQRANFLQWTEAQVSTERDRQVQDANQRARFYLRFYSPNRENDDLDKPKSIWRVYLDSGGRRFEGKVTRLNDKLIELQTLYPHQDRFSSPYDVSFDVPMTTVERADAKLTLTSSLGSAEFKFPALP